MGGDLVGQLGGLLLALLAAGEASGEASGATHRERALSQARSGEDASATFRSAVFLDDTQAGAEQWHDLAVSLMRVAARGPTRSRDSSPEDAREARRAARHGLWSLACFQLSTLLDPLELKVKPSNAKDNLATLLDLSPDARRLSRLDAPPPGYWHGNGLIAHDLGVAVAKNARQAESVLWFWRQILLDEREVPVAWVNLAVALNQARQWAESDERFYALSHVALAGVEPRLVHAHAHAYTVYSPCAQCVLAFNLLCTAFERALSLYRLKQAKEVDGVPVGGMQDNWQVYKRLEEQMLQDPDRGAHRAKAEAVTARLDWPAMRVDRWQWRRETEGTLPLRKPPPAATAPQLYEVRQRRKALALWAEGVVMARVCGWGSNPNPSLNPTPTLPLTLTLNPSPSLTLTRSTAGARRGSSSRRSLSSAPRPRRPT